MNEWHSPIEIEKFELGKGYIFISRDSGTTFIGNVLSLSYVDGILTVHPYIYMNETGATTFAFESAEINLQYFNAFMFTKLDKDVLINDHPQLREGIESYLTTHIK